MAKFNSDNHYIYYCGQESLKRNGVAITVNKRVWNAVLGCNLKNNRMISIHFKGKPFDIRIIQVYVPTTNTKEAEHFYEYLQDFLELTPKKKRSPFHHKGLECKNRSSKETWVTGKFSLGVQNKSKAKANRILPRKYTGHSKHPLSRTQKITLHMDIIRWSIPNSDWLYLCSQRWKSFTQSEKKRPGADYGSDDEIHITKFRLKLKKVGKTTRHSGMT